jgi:methionyl-tRNA synthetase
MEKKTFYLTTAIAYTSKIPHLGNTYEWILSDAIVRYKRMRGFDVFFLTGTDEHGQKIQEQAMQEGFSPTELVDRVAGAIREIDDTLKVSYDDFIRTTDPEHQRRVQGIFQRLYDQGDIYKDAYEGLYCVSCEAFYTESQLHEGVCPQCSAEVTMQKEEAYFFRLSKYQKRLEEHIEKNPHFIYPESRRNEMLNNFIRPGLRDLSVTRSSFDWGVPVPFDPKHVAYVWIDALSNYITAMGYEPYGESSERFKKYWPADVHVIGKDIVRFHTIYWPILLMALDLPLPKQVFGHPWLLIKSGETATKMSKSRGNVLYATDLVERYGLDRVRYSVLREMPFSEDGHFNETSLIHRSNTDLANVLGNLLNRTLAMSHRFFEGKVEAGSAPEPEDLKLMELADKTIRVYEEKMDAYRVSEAIEAVMELAKASNKYIDETQPWLLGREESKHDRLRRVLYTLTENLRILAILLTPFIPDTAEEIFRQLQTEVRDYETIKTYGQLEQDLVVGKGVPLFERLDELEEKEEPVEEKEMPKEVFKPTITYDEFAKLDMRVGEILSCEDHPKADKLYILKVRIGNSERQIVSGLKDNYSKEELVGKKAIVLCNLAPRNLRGQISNGMVLAEVAGDEVKILEAVLPSGTEIS